MGKGVEFYWWGCEVLMSYLLRILRLETFELGRVDLREKEFSGDSSIYIRYLGRC